MGLHTKLISTNVCYFYKRNTLAQIPAPFAVSFDNPFIRHDTRRLSFLQLKHK